MTVRLLDFDIRNEAKSGYFIQASEQHKQHRSRNKELRVGRIMGHIFGKPLLPVGIQSGSILAANSERTLSNALIIKAKLRLTEIDARQYL